MADWSDWHNRDPLILVNDDRTILVTRHPNGTVSVALREEAGHIWGPPIDVHPEYAHASHKDVQHPEAGRSTSHGSSRDE